MIAFIQFSSKFTAWSAFTFWVVVVSIVITLFFTVVVFCGGIADLKFLLRSMDERNNSPPAPPAESESKSHN